MSNYFLIICLIWLVMNQNEGVMIDDVGSDEWSIMPKLMNVKTSRFSPLNPDSSALEWGDIELCGEGEHAVALETKFTNCPSTQQWTGLNGIRITCSNGQTLTSSHGSLGSWSKLESKCSSNQNITGFQIKSNKHLNRHVINGIRLVCFNEKILKSDEANEGVWTKTISCPKGTSVCGLQTQLTADLADKTTINNVQLFCCEYEPIDFFDDAVIDLFKPKPEDIIPLKDRSKKNDRKHARPPMNKKRRL